MKTITINTAELSGAALDWAVAVAIGKDPVLWDVCCGNMVGQPAECCLDPLVSVEVDMKRWEPSTDWSQGGQLIEEYFVYTTFERPGLIYASLCESDNPGTDLIPGMFGGSYLIASCRAIVAAKLGVAVDVPADLVEPTK